MLDIKFLRENADIVRKDLKKRQDSEKIKLLDEFIDSDKEWKEIKSKADDLRARRNKVSEEINKAKKEKKDAEKFIKEAQDIPLKIKELEVYDRLRVIDKSGIPDYIQNDSQDIIYCFNVLQHCSQKDRNQYLQQSYDKLKNGGFFIGGMFVETKINKDESCWGIEGVDGRKYANFFNQLTEVQVFFSLY